ncbi:F510_1955 family glycosylhydrolase [Streptomyces sp. TRM68367]|uniref:F510_1955 family glycosylhydrolase n=1 Tax=Streptomyces sp. TRM68367 TaxID=2758415 RepID=UPI00165AB107|nr:exo-alpha-sialidase [Streptomyces sp. TRM68367]MBC9724997.1 exo-alpha-sialidase [Streptomyces sp. TRM68367]
MAPYRRPVLAATAILLTATLTACANGSATSGSEEPSASGAAAAVSHIHGLGIDPADGRLYVATHEGVFAVEDDGAHKRVSDTADYMGFTVAGPNTFLGSGHPAEGSGDHANRGLIKSTDAGKTWKTLSLGGEADFHALEYAHNTIYGYDSTNGLLRVSKDGEKWDNRAELAALDIAVSPNDPDVLLATTQNGIAKSTDGGETFNAGTEPVMAFLSWAKPNALYGIDPAGGLHRSADGGITWKKAGNVPGGQPQALTAVDADRILAATQDGVYESRNGGKTFAQRLPVSVSAEH